jgi:hypothetical protein
VRYSQVKQSNPPGAQLTFQASSARANSCPPVGAGKAQLAIPGGARCHPRAARVSTCRAQEQDGRGPVA